VDHERPIENAVIELWREARNPLYIAQKLNLRDETGHFDVEQVLNVLEDPANYPTLKLLQQQGAR